jgi:hypothetical protein
MAGMGVHVINSLRHGELRVVTTAGNYGHGRTWRALLDPVPIRLRRHLTSFDGVAELEVLSGLLRQIDRYDREGAHARLSESDPEQ